MPQFASSPVSPSSQTYQQVSLSEDDAESHLIAKEGLAPKHKRPWPAWIKIAGLIGVTILIIAVVFMLGYASGSHMEATLPEASSSANSSSSSTVLECKEPGIRKEWRSLANEEKQEYLDAVQCLMKTPSILGMNGSVHDDFSWVHNLIAHDTHGKAPFLTWHRRFLSTFERYLQQMCNYDGMVPFWDWTLDWENPAASPIFHSKLGFGGDGNPQAAKYGNAYCVTDMPFEDFKPQWAGSKWDPHCLTRSFLDDWLGKFINPEAIAGIMAAETYEDFFISLENRAHDIIPTGVQGDFHLFTAPNDPVFYLHHSQLDRIWWLWQMKDKQRRVVDYAGERLSGNVSLTDTIPMAGLDQDRKVSEIMDTEDGILCYRYMYI